MTRTCLSCQLILISSHPDRKKQWILMNCFIKFPFKLCCEIRPQLIKWHWLFKQSYLSPTRRNHHCLNFCAALFYLAESFRSRSLRRLSSETSFFRSIFWEQIKFLPLFFLLIVRKIDTQYSIYILYMETLFSQVFCRMVSGVIIDLRTQEYKYEIHK